MTITQFYKKGLYSKRGYSCSFRYGFLVCEKQGLSLVVVVSPSGYESVIRREAGKWSL